jgi:hypothetical protein
VPGVHVPSLAVGFVRCGTGYLLLQRTVHHLTLLTITTTTTTTTSLGERVCSSERARAEESAGARGRAHRTKVRLESQPRPCTSCSFPCPRRPLCLLCPRRASRKTTVQHPPWLSCLGQYGRAGHLDSLAYDNNDHRQRGEGLSHCGSFGGRP